MRLKRYFKYGRRKSIEWLKKLGVRNISRNLVMWLPPRGLQRLAQMVAAHRCLTPWPDWKCDAVSNSNPMVILREEIISFVRTNHLHFQISYRFQRGITVRIQLTETLGRNLFLSGSWEPNEFAFLNTTLKPGMTFLDLGANFGLYTVWAARRVGHRGLVIALEPSKREFTRLEENVRLNRLENVQLLNIGASNSRRTAELHISDDNEPGLNTLGEFIYPGVREVARENVSLDTIDNVLQNSNIKHVDVVKIDVEGHEVFALQGMTSILKRDHPVLLVEVNEMTLQKQGCTTAQLFDILTALDYQAIAFDAFTGLPISVSATSQSLSNEMVWFLAD